MPKVKGQGVGGKNEKCDGGPENAATLQSPGLFGWTADRNRLCKDTLSKHLVEIRPNSSQHWQVSTDAKIVRWTKIQSLQHSRALSCPTDQQESHRLPFNIPVRAREPLPLPLKPSRVCLPEQIKGLSLKIEACHWPAYLNKQRLPVCVILWTNLAGWRHLARSLK